jgi:hypothetical protein
VPRPPDDELGVSRRRFLACCSALAVSCAARTRLPLDTRSAYVLLTDPPLSDYEQVLNGLIRTVLPFEQVEFPVTVAQVQTRLLHLFRLEHDPRFLVLQRMFILFDQTDLFPHFTPISSIERRMRDGGAPDAAVLSAAQAHDRELYAGFARDTAAPRFASLPLDRQREYFDLWRRSRFLLRREFHATARAVIMITAYSMTELWTAIGYAGPLVVRGEPDES